MIKTLWYTVVVTLCIVQIGCIEWEFNKVSNFRPSALPPPTKLRDEDGDLTAEEQD